MGGIGLSMSTGLGIGAATTVATIATATIGVEGATSAVLETAEIAESFTGKNAIKQYYGEPI